MSSVRGLRARLRSFFRPRAEEARMREEFEFHLAMEIQKNLAAGMTPQEARRHALVSFGGIQRHREAMRDGRGGSRLEDVARDTRVALRVLRANPGFASVALTTIALGVGASTAVFSAVDAVLFRPLPFSAPERLVEIDDINLPSERAEGRPKSAPDIRDARALEVFTHVAAYAPGGLNLSGGGEPRRVRVGVVTPDLLPTLGVSTLLGRTFSAEEGAPNGPRVAILSEDLWRRRYAADAEILGTGIELDGVVHEVVGVMPRGFGFPEQSEVWMPLSVPITRATWEPFRQYIPFRVVARLAPGMSAEQANARVLSLLAAFGRGDEAGAPDFPLVRPLQASLVASGRTALLVLLGATALVLLVVCANVANLLLSRAVVRRREIALRAVLGATSGRVVRQLMTESLVLAVIGTVLGLGVAFAGTRVLGALVPSTLHGLVSVAIDWRVFGFAAALALLTGCAFGLWPALAARRAQSGEMLKAGAAGAIGTRDSAPLRRGFVVLQVALALMLVVGSSLMLRSLHALLATDAGVQAEQVVTLEVSLAAADYPTSAARRQFYTKVLDELRSSPGIEAAAAINELPLRGVSGVRFPMYPEGAPPTERDMAYMVQDLRVTPEYFRAMGIRVLAGRAPFARGDSEAAREVAISETLANTFWPGESPIGARLQDPFDESFEVVGVVADVRPTTLGSEPISQAYFSLLDAPYDDAALVARGRAPAGDLARVLRNGVRAAAPGQAVYNVRTMEQVIAAPIASRRANTGLITAFGMLALVLAAVGVYGVIAFGVAQRTREIGIRLALGAEPRALRGAVLREAVMLTGAGVVLGLVGAWMLSRFLGALVYGVTPRDPIAFGVAPAVLLAVAVLAAVGPARRATHVDPMEALRLQ